MVSGAYRTITDRTPPTNNVPTTLLWRKDVLVKVSVFAWRLFRHRLSSKTNLFRRGIIPPEAQICIGDCGQQESETHLFLSCTFFGHIWQLIQNWVGVYSADSGNNVDHFYQFGTFLGYEKSRCSLMHLIWFATVWVLWKERNDRIFRGQQCSHYQLLEAIKLLSFWWFKAKFTVFPYCFHDWCQAPFLCAGIG